MTPDDIMGIFEGTVRRHQVDAPPATLSAYVDWLSRNWRGLSSDDLSALLSVGAAAYKLQKLTDGAIRRPCVEAARAPVRFGAVPLYTGMEDDGWKIPA